MTEKNNYEERILRVMVYIQNHLDNALSLDELASVAHFSPFHFHRIFSSYANESIQSYIKRLRLERATKDLTFTDLSLSRIAERAGYDTQQSFHRAFKTAFHETPKNFRDKKLEYISQYIEKKKTDDMPTVEIKYVDPITVAFVRHIGAYHGATQPWLKLVSEVGMNVVLSPKTLKISIPYDAPETTPEDKIRFDACVSVNELPNFKPKGAIGIQTLHGGKYAIITHRGSINTLDSAYMKLYGLWLPQSGYEPADYPNFVLHRTIPGITPESELETDIYLPIIK